MSDRNTAGSNGAVNKEAGSTEPGLYCVGEVRGVAIRTQFNRATNESFEIPELAVERDGFQVQKWQFTREQKEAGMVERMREFVGKKVLIQVSVNKNGNFVNYYLAGLSMPRVVS